MSSPLKISKIFNNLSWVSFTTLLISCIIIFIVSLICYSNWNNLVIPANQDCKIGFSKNFDKFQVNGIIEPIPNTQTQIKSTSEPTNNTSNSEPQNTSEKNEYGPGPFKSVFRNNSTNFFETNDVNVFAISYNVISQDAPFTIVIEESDNTIDWKGIQTSLITSKVGSDKIEFKTNSKYLRLTLVSNGRNVVLSSLRVEAVVYNQDSKKNNVRKTMFGTIISSTLLLGMLFIVFILIFVDIRKLYEYLIY